MSTKKTSEQSDIVNNYWRAVLDASNDAIFIHDLRAGILVGINRRAEEMYGYSKDQLLGKNIGIISSGLPPCTERDALRWVLKVRAGKPQILEWQARHADGSLFPVEVSVRSEEIDGHLMVVAAVRDITERMQAQKELAASEKKSRAWLADSSVCTKVLDLDFNLQYMSEACVKALDIDDVTQLYGKPYPFSFFPDSFCERMVADLQKVKSTGKKLTQEGCVLNGKGEKIWFEATIIPVKDDLDRIEYFMVISVDITARKQAENELLSSNMFLDSVIDQSPFPMFIVDLHGTVIRTNQAMCNTLDLKSEQLLNHYSLFQNANLQGPALNEIRKTVFERHEVAHFTSFWEMGLPGSPDESKKTSLFVNARMIPVLNHAGELIHVICQWLDISEQKKAKKELEESEQRFRSAVENSPIPTMMYAEDGTVLSISRAWCQITGYSKEELSTLNAWTDRAYGKKGPAAVERINRLFDLDESINEGDISIRIKNGNLHIWDFSTAPLGTLPDGQRLLITMARDVTQQRADEQQLKKHNKELEYFNKLSVGREMRMIELKKEVNALCDELGRDAVYSLYDFKDH